MKQRLLVHLDRRQKSGHHLQDFGIEDHLLVGGDQSALEPHRTLASSEHAKEECRATDSQEHPQCDLPQIVQCARRQEGNKGINLWSHAWHDRNQGGYRQLPLQPTPQSGALMATAKLVLDTHAWIWYAEGSSDLGPRSKSAIAAAIRAACAFVCVVSYREVGVLAQKGKIRLAYETRKWVREATARVGVRVIDLRRLMVLESLVLMQSMATRDPFDHMIVATAIRCKAILASADRPIRAPPGA